MGRINSSTPDVPYLDRGPPVTPSRWLFLKTEYGPIEIRLFAFELLGLNMLKCAN